MKHYFINSIFGILLSTLLLTSCKKDIPSHNNNTNDVLHKSNNNTFATNKTGAASNASPISGNKGPRGLIIIWPDTSKQGR